MAYTLPQVRVFQEFEEAPNDVTQNLNPFIIGPNYQLIRYSDEDERDDCTHKAYKGSAIDLSWATGVSKSAVDTSWFKVTLANAYVKLGDGGTPTCHDTASNNGTKFEFSLSSGKSLVGDTASELAFGTAVKAGDYVGYKTSASADWAFTKINTISGGKLSTGEIAYTLKNKSTGATFTGLGVNTADYLGEAPVTVRIHVAAATTDGSYGKLTWTSNVSGINSSAVTELTSSGIDLGKGLKITASATVTAGDYVLAVTLVEPYVRDTVKVADLIPTNATSYGFFRLVDDVELDEEFLTPSTTGVAVAASATVVVASASREVVDATAYLTQRNLRKDHTDGVYSFTSDADIIRELGAITPDNPLAYGAHVMLLNCASASLKYIGLESDDTEGWATALDRASLTTDVYAFCPLTEDRTIIDSVVAHCETMSSEENKAWRIAFFSMPTDEEVDVTPNVYGVKEKCKVSGTTLTCYQAAEDTVSTVSAFTETVQEGDTVEITKTTGAVVTTTVASVTSNTTLTLADSISDASSARCAFSIVHTRGRAEYVSAIATTSESFKNHRAYNVFPNKLKNTDGEYVSGMYGAAAVCALACSVVPQQPITNVEINGFSDLPDVYAKYNRDELNTIAAGGTLILMQDKIGGSVYVRHQISTAYSDGNLNTTELSLTKNLDSISFYFANRFAPYIGRYNITDDLLTELKGILLDGLAYLETSTETNRLIGPQIIADGTEIRSLYRSTEEKDKVYANVALNLPAPFNNFDLHLSVI